MDYNKVGYCKSFFILVIFFFFSYFLYGQATYGGFCEKSYKINNTGMVVLGSWAIANIATGAYGWSHFSEQKKYFSQMNFFWNVVNLSIAGIALYSNFNTDCSFLGSQDIMNKHIQIEKILLINTFLDVGYIGTGFLLRHLSTNQERKTHLLKGYGNSLILQGGFLFIFDLFMYAIMRNERLDFINTVHLGLIPDMSGFQFVLNINI